MKYMQRTRRAEAGEAADEQPVPEQVDETSADVSDNAALGLADIDAVLADVELTEAASDDKAQARAELVWLAFAGAMGAMGKAELDHELEVWRAKYGHLVSDCEC